MTRGSLPEHAVSRWVWSTLTLVVLLSSTIIAQAQTAKAQTSQTPSGTPEPKTALSKANVQTCVPIAPAHSCTNSDAQIQSRPTTSTASMAQQIQISSCANTATGLIDGIYPDAWTRTTPTPQPPCFVGTWTSNFAGTGDAWTLNANLTGSVDFHGRLASGGCANVWPVTVTINGNVGFTATATNPGGGSCDSTFFDIVTLQSGATITLSRQTLTSVQATGTPSGGTFSYTTTTLSGGNVAMIAFANGNSATTNPNLTSLTAPAGGGSPTPGGLASIQAQYTTTGPPGSDTFQVPTFGMSCYMIALESDYGNPAATPNTCSSTTIYGVSSRGTVTNPNGLAGTYCASFIANVKLQGSAQLTGGGYIQYRVGSQTIISVPSITGHDGTPVVAGQTVARDLAIIPATGVLVDVDHVGAGLLANDTGGAIRGYRLDLFNGAGRAACATYSNPIGVAACETAQPNCPGSILQ